MGKISNYQPSNHLNFSKSRQVGSGSKFGAYNYAVFQTDSKSFQADTVQADNTSQSPVRQTADTGIASSSRVIHNVPPTSKQAYRLCCKNIKALASNNLGLSRYRTSIINREGIIEARNAALTIVTAFNNQHPDDMNHAVELLCLLTEQRITAPDNHAQCDLACSLIAQLMATKQYELFSKIITRCVIDFGYFKKTKYIEDCTSEIIIHYMNVGDVRRAMYVQYVLGAQYECQTPETGARFANLVDTWQRPLDDCR